MLHKHLEKKQITSLGQSSLTTAWTKTHAHTSHADMSKCVCARETYNFTVGDVNTESYTPPNIQNI